MMNSLCLVALVFGFCACDVIKRSDDTSPLEAVVSRLTSDLQVLEAKVTALTSTVGGLKERVGFSVTVSHDSSMNKNVMVKFDHVLYNEGNGYASSSGFFVAPVSGMYCIYIKTETSPQHGSGFEVLKEGAVILHIYGPPHDAHQTPFDAMVTRLDKGQRLWVQTCCLDGLVRASTHFGGFLIHGDNS